jgi:hypothetical protein
VSFLVFYKIEDLHRRIGLEASEWQVASWPRLGGADWLVRLHLNWSKTWAICNVVFPGSNHLGEQPGVIIILEPEFKRSIFFFIILFRNN